MQETRVQFLGWEDPLEEEMATHSSILAWEIPWTEEPGGLQFVGSQRVGHNWATDTFIFSFAKNVVEILPYLFSFLKNFYLFLIIKEMRHISKAHNCCVENKIY